MTDRRAARLKICCIASLAEARLAIERGASAIGLVSAMPSGPGVIDEALIAEIAAAVPAPTETFLLTALTDADAIAEQHARCATTTLQLVDSVAPAELVRLRALVGDSVRIVQVIHVRDDGSIDEALAAEPFVDALLLDSGNPALAVKQLGGTGRVHDWSISARLRESVKVPVWLAGGLTAHNVTEAIRRVRPFGVDICSGARREGVLDPALLDAISAATAG